MSARIVVATDFSPRSDRALRRATLLAKQFDFTMSLVHVVDEDQPQYLIDPQLAAARTVLEEMVGTLRDSDGLCANAEVVVGDVFSGILGVAEELSPQIVVLGPHRRQLRDVFVGTTAERTIAHSRFPVLMTAGVPAASYDRVLMSLKMDDSSSSMANWVRMLSIDRKTALSGMHAFDAPAEGLMHRAMRAPEEISHYLASAGRKADQAFKAMLKEVGLPDIPRILRPIAAKPARTILDAADEQDAGLIILGNSRSRGVKRFLLGNVAQEVLADTRRDVLVLPK